MGGTWGPGPVWKGLLRDVLREGHAHTVRGMETTELSPAVAEMSVSRGVPFIARPGASLSLACYETLWVLAGQYHVRGLVAFPYMLKFAEMLDDKNGFFKGAYGPSVVVGLRHLSKLLTEDLHTRRAFIPVYAMENLEVADWSRDVPCTLGYHVAFHETPRLGDVLTLTAIMRSSDVWVGMVYDTFLAGSIAHIIAGVVQGLRRQIEKPQVNVRFMSMSSHVYERNYLDVGTLLNATDRVPVLNAMSNFATTMTAVRNRTSAAEEIACAFLTGKVKYSGDADGMLFQLRERAAEVDVPDTSAEFNLLVGACSRVMPGLKVHFHQN